MNDYEAVINNVTDTIINDPTAAKQKFKSAIDLATYVYVPNIDFITLQKHVDIVANSMKKLGKEFFPYTILEFRNAVKTLIRENNKKLSQEDLIKQKLGHVPNDCGEFVEMWISKFAPDIIWNYNDTITRHGKIISVDEIITEMRNCENALKLKYGKDLLFANLKLYRQKAKVKRLGFFRDLLLPSRNVEILKQFHNACNGFFIDADLAYNGILDFIWQVKRELYGLPIKYHHFLYIHSADQGTGKTEFVNLLKTPLLDLSARCHLEKLFDPAYISMPEYYILDFDDVSGKLGGWEISRLKEMITAKEVPGRFFYSNDIQQISRNFHGIATSNKPISSVIADEQMRRFLSLEVKPLPKSKEKYEEYCVNQKEWDAIASIDYLKLWQAVDHKGETFLTKHRNNVYYNKEKPVEFIENVLSRWAVAK